MTLTHFYFIFYLTCLLVVLSVTASTHNHDKRSLKSEEAYNHNTDQFGSEAEYESEETLTNNFLSSWNAKVDTKSQPNSIILPILPEKPDDLKTTDTSKKMESQIPSRNNNEGGNNTSFFQGASAAFWNLMSDSGTLFHQIKNQSDNAIREFKQTGAVVGNAVENFVSIAFPKGTNTTFIEDMTNLAAELEKTGKEVENWRLKEFLVELLKQRVTVIPDFLEESDSVQKHVNNNYASHQMESFSPINNNTLDDPISKLQSRFNNIFILVGIGIACTASIILSIILLYILCTRREKSKTITQTLKNKKQSYSIEQSNKLKLDKITTQIEIEQRTDLMKDSKLDIEPV